MVNFSSEAKIVLNLSWSKAPTQNSSGYDKVSKHASIACRQQTDFVGKETKKKRKSKRK